VSVRSSIGHMEDPEVANVLQQQHNMLNQLQLQINHLQEHAHAQGEAAKPSRPPDFSGDNKDSPQVRSWLLKLQLYFDACHTADQRRVVIAITLLTDHALLWYQSLAAEQRPQTWPEFQAALIQHFQPISAVERAREKLAYLVQLRSVKEYTDLFRELCLVIGHMSEEEQLDRYKRGLKTNIRSMVEIANPQNWEAAAVYAERLDNIPSFRRPYTTSYRFQQQGQSMGHRPRITDGPTPMELGALQASRISRFVNAGERRHQDPEYRGNDAQHEKDVSERLCFLCHQPGHRARYCRNQGRSYPAGASNLNKRLPGKGRRQ